MLSKKEFINLLSKKGYTISDAETVTKDFLKTIEEILLSGESVRFLDFGTFEVRHRKPRKSKTLNSDEWITIPGFNLPCFAPSKALKRKVRGGENTD